MRLVQAPQPFQSRHTPGLLALWSRRWGSRFPLDLALWRQNTDGDPRHFRLERCWVIAEGETVRGCLVLKVPDDPPAWTGQDPRHAWISVLLVEPGRETDLAGLLVDRAREWLRGAGFTSVAYGGDPSHFFPGAPEDDVALGRALAHAGFRPGEVVYDLLGDVRHACVTDDTHAAQRSAGVDVGVCGRSDVPALLRFVDTHFPGRWAFETRQRLDVEPTPDDILLVTDQGDVVGFCHVYHRGSRRIGPSIYWRQAIGDCYGGLGPMGIAPALRGRGLGLALLAWAVGHLRRRGAERVVIDWTTLLDFYGRRGFQVWRTYRTWRGEL